MSTIALIGADGAGKSTIARRLQQSSPLPLKTIYMGLNIESSNVALPTSRLILRLKLKAIRRKATATGNTDPTYLTTHHIAHRQQKRGQLALFARTLHRLAEAWYRQCVSWIFQLRGYTVLYDRHFLFDTAPVPGQEGRQPLADRFFRWQLTHLYPRTDMVIFLDAEPDVLFRRKQEVPVDYLAEKRAAFLDQGRRTANFVRIDAAQPVDQVYSAVVNTILQFSAAHQPATAVSGDQA